MVITINHECDNEINKYDLLVVSLIEFISSSRLTEQEKKFMLKLISIKREGGDPFHRSSFESIKDSFKFSRPSQRIYRLKKSLRDKGYVNINLSNFSEEVLMLMDSEKVDFSVSIKK